MPESTFTIRVDDHLKEAFTEAARVSDRTGAQLIRDFMREYVQAKVEAGLKAIQEGRILSNEEVRERSRLRRERLLAAHEARA